MINHEHVMAPQYAERSGPGSTLEYSAPYRAFVERFIIEHRIGSVTDLGCGDAVVASAINYHGAAYHGVDVVRERVVSNQLRYPTMSFEHADLRTVRPRADLVLVKDVIQHWSTAEIIEWLGMMKQCSFRFALITNCNYGPTVNADIETGDWRAIDLTKPPFSVGEVIFSWSGTTHDSTKDVVLVKGQGA